MLLDDLYDILVLLFDDDGFWLVDTHLFFDDDMLRLLPWLGPACSAGGTSVASGRSSTFPHHFFRRWCRGLTHGRGGGRALACSAIASFFDDLLSSTSFRDGAEDEQHDEEDEEEAENGAECDADHGPGLWAGVEVGICGWYGEDLLLSLDCW